MLHLGGYFHKPIPKKKHIKKTAHLGCCMGIGYALQHEGAGMADWLFLILAIIIEFDGGLNED